MVTPDARPQAQMLMQLMLSPAAAAAPPPPPPLPPPPASAGAVVTVNVGGTLFTTRRSTLAVVPDSFLSALLSDRFRADRDAAGHVFIDRDPRLFGHVLAWLVRTVASTHAHSGAP